MSDDLKHERIYDPQKRREYYLRTRQLKGRTRGAKPAPAGFNPSGKHPKPHTPNTAAIAAKNRRTQRQRQIQGNVVALNQRLNKLKEVLRDLVEQAKKRSGVPQPVDDSPAPAKKVGTAGSKENTATREKATKTSTKPQHKTAAQKAEDAKRAKEFYEKNKRGKISERDKANALKAEIDDVEKKIAKYRGILKSSVAKARAQSTKQTGSKAPPSSKKGNNQNGSGIKGR